MVSKVTPTFIYIPKNKNGKHYYEILDGKQRLMTIVSFIRNEFAVDGIYYRDLNLTDLNYFYNTPFVYRQIKYYENKKGLSPLSMNQKIELFLQINEYGQHIDNDHLTKIKEKYML